MLTDGGRQFLLISLESAMRDARLFVEDADGNRAEADLDEGFPRSSDDDGVLTFQATFGEDEANFDWLDRGITMGPGGKEGEIDRSGGDDGRKAPGSIWTLRVRLDVHGGVPLDDPS